MIAALACWGVFMVVAGQLGGNEIEVSYRLSDRVLEPGSAPKLLVTVKNGTAAPASLARFESDPCFAAAHLGLSLRAPSGPAELATCAGKPGTPWAVAPHASETLALDLAALFPGAGWKKGAYRLSAQWTSATLPAGAQRRGKLDFVVAAPLARVQIAKREEVKLPDGARLKFSAHGHKSTGPGEESPLVVYGEFAGPGEKAAKQFQVSQYDSEGRALVLGDGYVFVLDASEYDASMTLRYFGRLQGL
jgi:hypothetical protein